MAAKVEPGQLAPRVRLLIVGGCAVTLLAMYLGMGSLWGTAEFATQRSHFGLITLPIFGVAAALAFAWLPQFPVARLLRVAVMLPIIHVVAIALAGVVWLLLAGDMSRALREWGSRADVASFPSPLYVLAGFAAMVAIGVVIQRRHGEWAHATVMLALAFLLLLGLWLPFLSNMAIGTYDARYDYYNYDYYDQTIPKTLFGIKLFGHEYTRRLIGATAFIKYAVIPPALVAIAFTAVAFRAPDIFVRLRRLARVAVTIAVPFAILFALSMTDASWVLYLESSYLAFIGLLLAIGSLTMLTAITWLRSQRAHRRLATLPKHAATVATDEHEPVARLEITSWLRGPHLAVRSFVVDTPNGHVPVQGAELVPAVPPTTTQLGVGDHVPVLGAGDRVIVAGHTINTDGPFRATDATDIAMLATQDARRYRFSDVALVVWRPAVAYLAILVAVALPYLSIVLT